MQNSVAARNEFPIARSEYRFNHHTTKVIQFLIPYFCSMTNISLEERIREHLKGQKFMHHLGFDLTIIEHGYVEGEMKVEDFCFQHFGLIHGGVMLTIADIVMGFAAYTCAPKDKKVVSASLTNHFLRPGKGDRLKAIGKVIKEGSKLFYVEAEIFVKNSGEWTLVGKANSQMAVV
jgi:uncharacterized protein (TIGR00369 family)